MYQVPLEMICRHDRTAEVCRAAVEEDGWQLENVPEEMKTPELCRKALETEAGFGNDFHRGLVQHIPSPEVCMEVLKECRENNPEELYGVAVAIRPEVMNGEMADFLLPLDGRCISILPVHLQTPERVRVAVETSGMSAVGRGGVPKSLLTPEVYVRCAAHSRESLMMIPWAERSPEVCLMAKTLYPDWVKNHPEFVPESVRNQDSIYTLNSLMESLTGEKFSYRQMTDFYNGKPLNVKRMETPDGVQKDKAVKFDKETGKFSFSDIRQERKRGLKMCKYSINSLVYWVTYVHNVVYSFYRSMIYCYINSTQRCAGSIVIDIIPTNGADKRKFFPFAPYFPVTNVIKRYFYPYFPAIIGIKGYSFPYFPYLSGIMKIKTALYSLFSRLDWHKTVVFPCLGEIYEGIRSLSWEIPVT